MPRLNITTDSAEKVWSSPDGQRTIYKVVMNWDGKKVAAKTYSKAIASEGFSGEVQTYEKTGRNGAESFVKQPQKEGGSYGGTSQGGTTNSGGKSYVPRDDSHIKAQWAIGQAVSVLTPTTDEGLDLEAIEALAKDLFVMVDRVKNPAEKKLDPVITDIPDQITLDDVNIDEEPVDLSMVDEIFGTKEKE